MFSKSFQDIIAIFFYLPVVKKPYLFKFSLCKHNDPILSHPPRPTALSSRYIIVRLIILHVIRRRFPSLYTAITRKIV